jgi:hypothetical protein
MLRNQDGGSELPRGGNWLSRRQILKTAVIRSSTSFDLEAGVVADLVHLLEGLRKAIQFLPGVGEEDSLMLTVTL